MQERSSARVLAAGEGLPAPDSPGDMAERIIDAYALCGSPSATAYEQAYASEEPTDRVHVRLLFGEAPSPGLHAKWEAALLDALERVNEGIELEDDPDERASLQELQSALFNDLSWVSRERCLYERTMAEREAMERRSRPAPRCDERVRGRRRDSSRCQAHGRARRTVRRSAVSSACRPDDDPPGDPASSSRLAAARAGGWRR